MSDAKELTVPTTHYRIAVRTDTAEAVSFESSLLHVRTVFDLGNFIVSVTHGQKEGVTYLYIDCTPDERGDVLMPSNVAEALSTYNIGYTSIKVISGWNDYDIDYDEELDLTKEESTLTPVIPEPIPLQEAAEPVKSNFRTVSSLYSLTIGNPRSISKDVLSKIVLHCLDEFVIRVPFSGDNEDSIFTFTVEQRGLKVSKEELEDRLRLNGLTVYNVKPINELTGEVKDD